MYVVGRRWTCAWMKYDEFYYYFWSQKFDDCEEFYERNEQKKRKNKKNVKNSIKNSFYWSKFVRKTIVFCLLGKFNGNFIISTGKSYFNWIPTFHIQPRWTENKTKSCRMKIYESNEKSWQTTSEMELDTDRFKMSDMFSIFQFISTTSRFLVNREYDPAKKMWNLRKKILPRLQPFPRSFQQRTANHSSKFLKMKTFNLNSISAPPNGIIMVSQQNPTTCSLFFYILIRSRWSLSFFSTLSCSQPQPDSISRTFDETFRTHTILTPVKTRNSTCQEHEKKFTLSDSSTVSLHNFHEGSLTSSLCIS